MNWAHEQGYIATVPTFPKQKKDAAKSKKHMKGRPITTEEMERMLASVRKTFPVYKNETPALTKKVERGVASLKHLLRGLWVSGLRLGEALALTWDQWADGIRIQVDGSDVFLLIDSEDQKNRETELYPVVDEFAEFLLATPEDQRSGHVFNPRRTGGVSRRVDTVSDWIVAIGKEACVKVDQKGDKAVYASAHDIRRAFGDRWSRIVPSMILKDLMRHASVSTTEKFYVGVNAKKTIEALREYQKASKVTLEVTPGEIEEGADSSNRRKSRAAGRT